MALRDHQYKIFVVSLAAIAICVLTFLRFYNDFDLPDKPAKPKIVVDNGAVIVADVELATAQYKTQINEDGTTFGLHRVTANAMSATFEFHADRERRVLAVGDNIDVLGISLSLTTETIKGSATPHMMLEIKNKTHAPIAYRIDTIPSSGERSCSSMVHVPHNAIAIAAGKSVKRAECVFTKGRTLAIKQIEVMRLPELGYFYLSSMHPDDISRFGERTLTGHRGPRKKLVCRSNPSNKIQNAIRNGRVTWRDLSDFYARHSCNAYSFFQGYKAFQQDGQHILPVLPGDL